MAELLNTVASWPTLLVVVVVFGFAPGFCLRLILLAYPHDDPRRQELLAELYAVPRLYRPLWVAEQLEVALFEGLSQRWRVRAAQKRSRGRQPARRRRKRLMVLMSCMSAESLTAAFSNRSLTWLMVGALAAVVGVAEWVARRKARREGSGPSSGPERPTAPKVPKL